MREGGRERERERERGRGGRNRGRRRERGIVRVWWNTGGCGALFLMQ